jgi:very-short-patch-repair endonuclease
VRGKDATATSFSRRQRRGASVPARVIWSCLRDRRLGGFKFVREEPIGPYTVDFCCRERKLVVEIDGSQHMDSGRDRRRDAWLRKQGYRVLRFWNNDALAETEGVVEAIAVALRADPDALEVPPHPSLSPQAGRG